MKGNFIITYDEFPS